MTGALGAGIAVGFAVALPLGAIGVLIVETGARHGLCAGFRAGLGTALCDGLYAALAVVAGTAVSRALEGAHTALAAGGAIVLAAFGLHLLRSAGRPASAVAGPPPGRGLTLRFLALTAVNPLTVTVFAGLIAGDPELVPGTAAGAAFVAGAFAASLAWQSTLAAVGAVLHHRLPPGARSWTRVGGGVLVLALAVRTALAA